MIVQHVGVFIYRYVEEVSCVVCGLMFRSKGELDSKSLQHDYCKQTDISNCVTYFFCYRVSHGMEE